MHNKKIFIALYAICVLFFTSCNNPPQSSAVDIESQVSVRELKSDGSISRLISTSGTVLAISNVDLNSEISGNYRLQNNPRTGQPFRLGDAVRRNELIIRLDDSEYENNIRLSSRQLSLEIAENELVKQKELYERGGATATQIRNTEVTVANAQYELTNAMLNLEKMNVKAPFEGVIVNLPHYTPDVRVSSNQPMVSIMNYANLFMEINLPESAIEHIQPNQLVYITHHTMPEDTLKGVISEISPAISSETRTFRGKIRINNSELKLRPGMFVKADVIIERSDNAIVIPKNVIQTARGNRRFVYVVERNVAVMRNLVIGIEDEDNVEVLEGLNENDQLVIRGFETLRENSRVRVFR